MKIASIFIPTYAKAPFPGQTPEPYPQKTREKFEHELVKQTLGVVCYKPADRLLVDPGKLAPYRLAVTRYDFEVDTTETALAEVIKLALVLFNVEAVTVYLDGEAEDFDLAAAEDFASGVHDWNAQ